MTRIKALIVEDLEEWQYIIGDDLQGYGCDYDVAGTYEEARKRLESNTYDIVTLDMALSEKEERRKVESSRGWLLLINQLRQLFPGPAIFVISASFGTQPQRVFDLNAEYGVQGFMDKEEFDHLKFKNWVMNVRAFKEAGGQLDITSRGLLTSNQPGVSTLELRGLYERQSVMMGKDSPRAERNLDVMDLEVINMYKEVLAILQRNKAAAELQKAQFGPLQTPPAVANSIHEYDREIQRIETMIAGLSSRV